MTVEEYAQKITDDERWPEMGATGVSGMFDLGDGKISSVQMVSRSTSRIFKTHMGLYLIQPH